MIIAVVGPTAVGKSVAAIDLAHDLGGPEAAEIISADALQLYRGMDVGTAKVTQLERRGIQHHQIDVLDISQEASVAAYQTQARRDLEQIVGRGRTPIIVGGSGLYVSAILDRIDFPGTVPEVRMRLVADLERFGAPAMHERLKRVDPASAALIDARNKRRVIRALEVNEVTGRSFQPVFPRHTSHYEGVVVVGLSMPGEELDARITLRTQRMFDDGLLDEVRALSGRGLLTAPTARTATGYREALAVLDGDMTIPEAIDAITTATRKLVKKQLTWFRRDPRVIWVEAGERSSDRIAQIIDRSASR
ncbi:tRNA (adenosine(37)-N6)-dimethylallyltransferase MiaA [Flaviflexus huanghaiensis]|uniref:tRNA (adenosine(37)-N6)-dimethylallyltransferase MiaA n=1 Tax=Flaviflexus huanghaiensis TaxID=1111473 RepID=UPI0015FDD2BD